MNRRKRRQRREMNESLSRHPLATLLSTSSSFPSLSFVQSAFLFGLFACCFTGCGSRQASVEGDISYDGQPIGVGRILFEPEDPKAIKRGGRFEGGHYKLLAPEG